MDASAMVKRLSCWILRKITQSDIQHIRTLPRAAFRLFYALFRPA
jgi:hypothetical protein